MARKAATKRTPKWLTRQQEMTWRSFGFMFQTLRSALEHQLEQDSDLSFIEYHVLARLSEEADRRLRMSELGRMCNASLSRLSHLIKRLESQGLVRREPDPTDGRFTLAILTNAGYKRLVASAPGHVGCVRQLVIGDFTAPELAPLRAMSDRIFARIDANDYKHELISLSIK